MTDLPFDSLWKTLYYKQLWQTWYTRKIYTNNISKIFFLHMKKKPWKCYLAPNLKKPFIYVIQTTVVIFFYRFWFLPLPNHPAEYAQMQQRFILSFPALKIWIKCTCSPIVIHPGDLSTCVFRKNMQKKSNLNTCDNRSHSCQADDTNARAKHTKCCHVWQMMDLPSFMIRTLG